MLTGKPTGKIPLGRPRRGWEDNIRMDLKEIYIYSRNWVDSAQDWGYWRALVNAALNLLHRVTLTILESTLNKYVSIRGIGLIRLRIGIIGELLRIRH